MSNGIYIHIPFCLSKCAYCDFNSKSGMLHMADSYIDEVIKEIKAFKGVCADTVYIGGGTPTTLSVSQLERLILAVKENFILADDTEFTVESNPKTADSEKYSLLKKLGVTRLSIGVQSFNDDELNALSRIHTGEDAKKAVEDAKKAGFTNISIDLMYGIPKQTIESFSKSIDEALSLSVNHISAYSLIIEEGTPFYDNTPELPTEELERELHYLLKNRLTKAGYEHYEISNYGKANYHSRHNMKYWQRDDYYGFGAGAHSFYGGKRYENISDICAYIKADKKIESETIIDEKEALCEKFMLGFRILSGFDTMGEFSDKLAKLKEKGLIKLEGNIASLTDKGQDLANMVFMEFLED